MRILRHHSILRCIYALLIALPMFSVLGRVIYTQSNKNAKDSYYGETINQEQYITPTQFNSNQQYHLYMPSSTEFVRQTSATDMTVTNVTLNGTTYDINTLRFYVNVNTTVLVIQGYNIPSNDNSFILSSSDSNNYEIVFTYLSQNNSNYTEQILPLTKYIEYNKYSYLDNAFDYSLSRFVDENHWGKINFFDWFTSLFVNINYNNNALYLHFINWYMNYAMLVSCAYILFLVLMWFINFSRRLLERGMNYDW